MTALDDLDTAVAEVKQQAADQQTALDNADAALVVYQQQAATDAATIATLTQELADCQSKPAPVSGAAPQTGLYVSGGAEASLEAAETSAGVPVGTLVPTWFFFSSIPSNPATAIANNITPLLAKGRDVIVNLSTAGVTWASVANGAADAFAKALPPGVRFVFNNEPDASGWHAPNFERGTPQDYDAAVKHLRTVLPSSTKVGFCLAEWSRVNTWLVTPWLYDFFSIDDDVYSMADWKTPTQTVAANIGWIPPIGRELIMSVGTIPDPNDPTHRTAWLKDIANVRGVSKWIYWGSGQFALTPAEVAVLAGV